MTPLIVVLQLLCSQGFSRQEYQSGLPCPPTGDPPNPGIEPRSSALQADSLLSEPPGKPKNTGVVSLSLLQGNFPTQESNPGHLDCRWNSLPAELPMKHTHTHTHTQINLRNMIFLKLEYNCFTVLHSFLLYSKVNQPFVV